MMTGRAMLLAVLSAALHAQETHYAAQDGDYPLEDVALKPFDAPALDSSYAFVWNGNDEAGRLLMGLDGSMGNSYGSATGSYGGSDGSSYVSTAPLAPTTTTTTSAPAPTTTGAPAATTTGAPAPASTGAPNTPPPTPPPTLPAGTPPSPPPKVKFTSGVGGISVAAAATRVFQKAYVKVLASQLASVAEDDIALENIRAAPTSRRRLLIRGLAHLAGDAGAERRLNSGGVVFDVVITVGVAAPAPASGAAPAPAPALDLTVLSQQIKAQVTTFQQQLSAPGSTLATTFKQNLKTQIQAEAAAEPGVSLSDIIADTAAFDNFDVASVTTAPVVVVEADDDDDKKQLIYIGAGAGAGGLLLLMVLYRSCSKRRELDKVDPHEVVPGGHHMAAMDGALGRGGI